MQKNASKKDGIEVGVSGWTVSTCILKSTADTPTGSSQLLAFRHALLENFEGSGFRCDRAASLCFMHLCKWKTLDGPTVSLVLTSSQEKNMVHASPLFLPAIYPFLRSYLFVDAICVNIILVLDGPSTRHFKKCSVQQVIFVKKNQLGTEKFVAFHAKKASLRGYS